jgi:hypothetical protein
MKRTHFAAYTTGRFGQDSPRRRWFDGDEGFLVAPTKEALAQTAPTTSPSENYISTNAASTNGTPAKEVPA